MFMSYIVGSIFLTIRFKYFDFIEWFDLNSSPQSLFERSSISDFFGWVFNVHAYLIYYPVNVNICTIWINSNNFTTKFFWSLILYLTVCSCHVTYAFQSESTLYSCLNVKELLVRSRHQMWRWSDCNWTRTQNHLVLMVECWFKN